MTLRPLYDAFGARRVFCVSMQAISGAGYPGVPSLDITHNVLPYIKNEEEKLEAEARKLLGRLDGDAIQEAGFGLSAHCNRVPVIDGHMVTMSVETERPVTPEEAARVMRGKIAVIDDAARPAEQPAIHVVFVNQPFMECTFAPCLSGDRHHEFAQFPAHPFQVDVHSRAALRLV